MYKVQRCLCKNRSILFTHSSKQFIKRCLHGVCGIFSFELLHLPIIPDFLVTHQTRRKIKENNHSESHDLVKLILSSNSFQSLSYAYINRKALLAANNFVSLLHFYDELFHMQKEYMQDIQRW